MVKITFEINEDYIREKADPEKIASNSAGAKGGGLIKAMLDLITFSGLTKQIDKGNTEFLVKQEDLGEKHQEVWEHSIVDVCMLAFLASKDE